MIIQPSNNPKVYRAWVHNGTMHIAAIVDWNLDYTVVQDVADFSQPVEWILDGSDYWTLKPTSTTWSHLHAASAWLKQEVFSQAILSSEFVLRKWAKRRWSIFSPEEGKRLLRIEKVMALANNAGTIGETSQATRTLIQLVANLVGEKEENYNDESFQVRLEKYFESHGHTPQRILQRNRPRYNKRLRKTYRA